MSRLLLLAQDFGPEVWLIVIAIFIAIVFFSFVIVVAQRYKRCPSNRVLVIYGKVRGGTSATCVHGGAAFVWPLFQDYSYLSLEPIQIEIPLRELVRLVVGDAIGPGLLRSQILCNMHRHLVQLELLRCFPPSVAGDDDPVPVHHNRLSEAEPAHRLGHGVDRRIEATAFPVIGLADRLAGAVAIFWESACA